MEQEKLKKQLEMLFKDLSSADKRCKKISKACGLEDNHLIEYAMEQTKEVLNYIESLKDSKETPTP